MTTRITEIITQLKQLDQSSKEFEHELLNALIGVVIDSTLQKELFEFSSEN